jgi:phosphotriesterase-related protein
MNRKMRAQYGKIIFLKLQFILLISCQNGIDDSGIMTVNGSVFSEEMGPTLSHEHVLVDWIGADSTGYHRWERSEVVERVLPYFLDAREKGVRTIAEFTPAYLGRDPYILAELSQRSGIQVITNTGYYGAVDNRFMPAHAFEESAEEIAARWINEFENGIDGSDLRPGFMKISVAREQTLSDHHKKIIDAAAKTHLATGLTIFSHTDGDQPAFEQVQHLEDHGVSPSAWVWTHAQSGTFNGNLSIAEKGGWIALDGVRYDPGHEPGDRGSIAWYADRILKIRDAGYLDRVLISHDAGWYDAGEPGGGDFRSYTDIFDYLLPELINKGFTEGEIDQLLIDNPKKAFSIRLRSH